MNTIAKTLTAGLVAVALTAGSLARPAEARGRDIAVGLAIGFAALAIASQINTPAPPPRRFAPGGRGPGGNCGWMKRKARQTGSSYWWQRYRDCRS